MPNTKSFEFNQAMWVPIAGWLYLFYGLAWPFENIFLLSIWWIDLFLSVVVHAGQIFIAIPIGKYHGVSKLTTAWYTFIFGATWWRPLQVEQKNLSQS